MKIEIWVDEERGGKESSQTKILQYTSTLNTIPDLCLYILQIISYPLIILGLMVNGKWIMSLPIFPKVGAKADDEIQSNISWWWLVEIEGEKKLSIANENWQKQSQAPLIPC